MPWHYLFLMLLVMPYLPNRPPTLKGISFEIRESEKIGVVGRTGTGKSSSLIVALYHLAEISEGLIHVDNVDCSKLQLNTLRSRKAIIPQDAHVEQLGAHFSLGTQQLICLARTLLSPSRILADPESIFYELCMNTGRAQFDVLVAKVNAQARAMGLTST